VEFNDLTSGQRSGGVGIAIGLTGRGAFERGVEPVVGGVETADEPELLVDLRTPFRPQKALVSRNLDLQVLPHVHPEDERSGVILAFSGGTSYYVRLPRGAAGVA